MAALVWRESKKELCRMLINVVDKAVTNYYEYDILGMEYAWDASLFDIAQVLGLAGGRSDMDCYDFECRGLCAPQNPVNPL